jgi:hypothetical protein
MDEIRLAQNIVQRSVLVNEVMDMKGGEFRDQLSDYYILRKLCGY